MQKELIKKYDVPVPRYTSYPTVPCWDENSFGEQEWWTSVERVFHESNRSKGISLYIHLPFCESLCTYCACNTRITKNHSVEDKYIAATLAEWDIYRQHFDETPLVREIHLGGGTPTFFNPQNLARLLEGLLRGCEIHDSYEFSFEGHPNNTTKEHLQILYDNGFRRVSFGVQDLDPKVQKAINRIQPLENLQRAVADARDTGYHSVSFDLIYGLPYQTVETVENTISSAIALRPDRISFYSYAHVPWLRPGQRGYEDADLPGDVTKRLLYETGRKLFLDAGYIDIGMDHFSLPSDSLATAYYEQRLHRNFMGYTTNQTDLLVGLGTSSISDARYAYAQNLKKVEDYTRKVLQGQSAVFKGHIQSSEDMATRRLILDIVCLGKTSLSKYPNILTEDINESLKQMEAEGIIEVSSEELIVTPEGRPFVRNIAAVFDKRMKVRSFETATFSKSI